MYYRTEIPKLYLVYTLIPKFENILNFALVKILHHRLGRVVMDELALHPLIQSDRWEMHVF